jgi:hypothetical protein
MSDLQLFTDRIRRFARTRRHLRDAPLSYRLGALALLAAFVGLCVLAEPWRHPAYQTVLAKLTQASDLPLLREFRLNAWVNLTLVAILGLFWLILLVVLCLRWTRRRPPLDEAFRMEELAGGLNSRLVSAWDFLSRNVQTPLTQAVVLRARDDLEFDFESRLDRNERNQQRARFLLVALCFVALVLTPAIGYANVLANLSRSWLAVRETLFPVEFHIEPGAGTIVRRVKESKETPNTQATLSIHFPGHEYTSVKLVLHTDKEDNVIELPVDAGGTGTHTLESEVDAEYTAYFEFGNRRSEEMTLIFAHLPMLVNMQTELVYPAYTRLLPRSLEGIQPRLVGLPGTRMVLGFTFSKELEEASLDWDEGADVKPLHLEVSGRFATVEYLHQRKRRATLKVRDKHGFTELEAPVIIDFEVQEDEKPQVLLPRHLKDDMPLLEEPAKAFGFGVQASDDFGITRVVLKWQKSSVDSPTSIQERGEVERVISPVQPKVIVNYEKVFEAMPLKPGDKITFWVEAHDNLAPGKPQMTASRRSSFFVFQDALGGLSIKELGFGSDSEMARERIPKATKATAVKAPEGLRSKEAFKNEFEAAIMTGTQAPTVRGEHSQATRDYFRLFSTVKYPDETPATPPRKDEKK